MLHFGILSTASIASRFIAGIEESGKGKVIAIASRSLEKATTAANELNIPKAYGSYDELFMDEEVDVVYIPTINNIHYRDAKKALQHNKHVVVEKPFTLDVDEAKELFELAKSKNLFIMETQKSVFLPTSNKTKQLIEDGVIGEIKYIELRAGFPARFNYDHWMYDLNAGGGSLNGSATYTIELMQHLFNHPTIKADGVCIKGVTNADEICNFSLIMNDTILVSSTITMNVAIENELVIYGTKGSIRVPSFWKANKVILTVNELTTVFDYPYQSEFVYEVLHIQECIEQGLSESPIMNKEKTIETIQIVNDLHKKWRG